MKKKLAWLILLFFAFLASADGVNFSLPKGVRVQQRQLSGNYVKFAIISSNIFLFAEDGGAGGRIVRKNLETGEESIEATNLVRPIQGLSFSDSGTIVAFPDRISKAAFGKTADIIQGFPNGDYGVSRIEAKDGSLYFGQGTVTNSGIVGPDNTWLSGHPSLRDLPCQQVYLSGLNVASDNFLTEKKNDKASTGSFMPFNAPAAPGEMRGFPKCSGAIYTSNLNGTNLKVYAWGFHAPQSVSVSDEGDVWVLDRGMENRGNRPIKDGVDSLYKVEPGGWYGWPDYQAGVKVEQAKIFAADPGAVQKPFLITPLGKYFLFFVSPKNAFPGQGLAVSESGVDLIDLKTKQIQGIVSVSSGQKILDAKFGPDGFYFLVDEGSAAAIYRIGPEDYGSVGGGARSQKTVWPWVLNSSLVAVGLFAYFFFKRLHRVA